MKEKLQFITINELSDTTGLPVNYLKHEADAGRLPYLRVGRSLRFDHILSIRCLQIKAAETLTKEGVDDA